MKPKRISLRTGQESVWDYPRPPRVEETRKRIVVELNGVVFADSARTKRVLETSHPPVNYIPLEDIKMDHRRRRGALQGGARERGVVRIQLHKLMLNFR